MGGVQSGQGRVVREEEEGNCEEKEGSGGREGGEGRIPRTDMGMTGAPSSGAASLSVPTLALTPQPVWDTSP